MRVVGIIVAVVLIAACPPRRGRVVYRQPCPPPCVAVATQPAAPPVTTAEPTDPVLEGHLLAWEKRGAGLTNLRSEITLKRTDVVFKREVNYAGVVLCMRPNLAILRLDNSADPTKTDYEAYICDGKSVFVYEGVKKTVTEIKIPQNQAGVDNLMLDFLAGMKPKDAKERFDITLFKTDERYIYLDIKPLRPADQREFKHLRLALYGPGPATAKVAYLPAQVYMVKPNDDTELWKFSNPQVDVPGVEARAFQFREVPKGWKFQQVPESQKP